MATTKDNKQSKPAPKAEAPKQIRTRFVGATKELSGHIFYYGKGMDTTCLTTREKILEYVGSKYTASERKSLELGKLKLVGVRKPEPWSKAKYDGEPFIKQKQWDQDLKRYNAAEWDTLANLFATQCGTRLRYPSHTPTFPHRG